MSNFFSTLLDSKLFSGFWCVVISIIVNFFITKHMKESDQKREYEKEQKRLNKKTILAMNQLCIYYHFIIKEIKKIGEFLEKNNMNQDNTYLINKIKSLGFICNKIILSEDDIFDIVEILGMNRSIHYRELIFNINYVIDLAKSYDKDCNFIIKQAKNGSALIDQEIFKDNPIIILRMNANIRTIHSISNQITEEIINLLSILINSDHFYEKDKEINLPKIDGGFETIKRTAP
ncbi:hypothetical protein FBY58_0128 [Zymomonas mobilis]|uniref:Uncharacterized protein n=1 Tax=Zymomonas mobilis TaxID=542 RepID=A0A542VZ42_ZYMMB|nr:hypothetical protein [Zymomonas mobilis]TQL16592.1 hypothetical protein FBY58_0128 [Zymomonas mobilis]